MRTPLAMACLLLTLVPAGISAQSADAIDAPRITQQDFKKLFLAKNVIIVDTRTADAFKVGHIPGAVLLPLEGQLTWPESYETVVTMLQKTRKPVVAYCA